VTPDTVKQFANDVLRPDARVVLHAVPSAAKAAPSSAPGKEAR
jgi:hypothetical protein